MLRKILFVVLFVGAIAPAVADEVCPIGYTQTQYVTTEYVEQEYFINDGFTQLEYIESDGTQWIDTEIAPNNSTGVLLEASVPNASKENRLIGVKDSDNLGFSIGANSGKVSFSFGNAISPKSDWNISNNTKFTAKLNYLGDRKAVANTGSEFALSTLSSGLSETMILFGQHNNGISTSISRIYNCKISDDETLVRDFIPAIRNKDNAIGMFDNITGMFFTNTGSGDFIAGPEVEEEITMEGKTTNLFDKNTVFRGAISSADGTIATRNDFIATDYIKIKGNTSYYFDCKIFSNFIIGLAFYDENKTFISGVNGFGMLNSKTAVSPANAVYLRHCIYINENPDWETSYMIVKGDTAPASYVPYGRYIIKLVTGGCVPCPPNTYKDFIGNSACIPCPSGMLSPSGSTNVNNCGRVLHVGDFFTFMPVGKRTEHGLCAMLDGVKYCADVYERE